MERYEFIYDDAGAGTSMRPDYTTKKREMIEELKKLKDIDQNSMLMGMGRSNVMGQK